MVRAWSAGAVVTPGGVLSPGTVVADADGRVEAVISGIGRGAVDLGQATVLLPGAVDLHCDAVEKLVEPRPGVRMPLDVALDAHDRRLAGAGFTTAYAAVSLAGGELGLPEAAATIELIDALRDLDGPRIEHRVHLRVEVTDPDSVETAEAVVDGGSAHMVSLMDHTPGRGQFTSVDAYVAFHTATYGRPEAEVRARAARKQAMAEQVPELAGRVARAAHRRGIPLACHDLDRRQVVEAAAGLGAVIAEFPTTIDVACHARQTGLAVGMGSPNLLRGASSSGNVAAAEVLGAGCLDLLMSDYYPEATWPAALSTKLGLPAVADLVAGAPARAVGLADRGELVPGRLADLVAIDARRRLVLTVRGGLAVV